MKMNLDQKQARHILYSSGQLIDSTQTDFDTVLKKLADATRRSSSQVKDRLLTGKRKKLKSSSSLIKLISLQEKLTNCGLNVYIETNSENS